MRTSKRRNTWPAEALLNKVEIEGVIAQWPLLKRAVLMTSLDISTKYTTVRIPVHLFGDLAFEMEPKEGRRPLKPGSCVKIAGKLSGWLSHVKGRAVWVTYIKADTVDILADGGFAGMPVVRPVFVDSRDDDFPAEAF